MLRAVAVLGMHRRDNHWRARGLSIERGLAPWYEYNRHLLDYVDAYQALMIEFVADDAEIRRGQQS